MPLEPPHQTYTQIHEYTQRPTHTDAISGALVVVEHKNKLFVDPKRGRGG